MDFSDILGNGVQAINLILLASLPPVLVAAIVGVLVSLVQALTQVQEQTLSFGIKLIAVILTLLATMESIGNNLLSFTQHVFNQTAVWNF